MMTEAPDGIAPRERQALRTLVKQQFKVLRNDVKRRQAELLGEIEAALLEKYRGQDETIRRAQEAAKEAERDYVRALQAIVDEALASNPEMTGEVGRSYGGIVMQLGDRNRAQEHRAAIASIPQTVANAQHHLDTEELSLMRELTVGSLTSEQASAFVSGIPTVGQLVPKTAMPQLEASDDSAPF